MHVVASSMGAPERILLATTEACHVSVVARGKSAPEPIRLATTEARTAEEFDFKKSKSLGKKSKSSFLKSKINEKKSKS